MDTDTETEYEEDDNEEVEVEANAGIRQPGAQKTKNNSILWSNPPGDRFRVRMGPNYKVNGNKGPSADPLYNLVGMDMLKSTERISNIGSFTKLPGPIDGVDDLEMIRKSGFPRILIVNLQLPDKAPSLWGSKSDNPGVSCLFYFSVKPETVNAMNDPDGTRRTPAINLAHRFVTEWQMNDDIRRRFKAIGLAENISQLGIPGAKMVEKFNGKPVIFFKCAKIFQGEDYLEIDLLVHSFPYHAKSILNMLRSHIPDIHLLAGFVIQGETDDELPETLLGGAEAKGIDFKKAEFISIPSFASAKR